MDIRTISFGSINGKEVVEHSLVNDCGMTVSIISYGAIITKLIVPGNNGFNDVVLGFDNLESYQRDSSYIGAVVGRVANRIRNGSFSIDGREHHVQCNEGAHHLHGGTGGFHCCLWESRIGQKDERVYVELQRVSKDGECGYPGNLDVGVTYWLDNNNVLGFKVNAETDQATPVNIAQHSYFNLGGHSTGNVEDHLLKIQADAVTEVDGFLLPTGKKISVVDTPYDFNHFSFIKEARARLPYGLDCNYVLSGSKGEETIAAELQETSSGRCMRVVTTKPGVQVYGGQYIPDSLVGKGGASYGPCSGLCLETQYFPDSVNQTHFPTSLLRPGERYRHQTTYSFSSC